jgi:hypothetical protein
MSLFSGSAAMASGDKSPPSPGGGHPPVCQDKIAHNSGHETAGGTIGGLGEKDYYVHVYLGYHKCVVDGGADWSRPRYVTVIINREGRFQNCNRKSPFHTVPRLYATAHFHDNYERSQTKRKFSFKCDEDTVTHRTVFWAKRNTKRMFFSHKSDPHRGAPSWRVRLHIDFPDNIVGADGHLTIHGHMK